MEIVKTIDHTNLSADAVAKDIIRVCSEAKQYGFRGVCINPRWVGLAKKELEGSGIKVVTVIDWPCGAASIESRVCQAIQAKKDGADEIDPVIDIGNLKMGNYDVVLKDLKALSEICSAKVIIETGFLTEQEITKASLLVRESGAICVKTSTGMSPKVDVEIKAGHIRLMREAVGPEFLIKAAGGIKTAEAAQKMIKAGADIIGASSGVAIITGNESDMVEGE